MMRVRCVRLAADVCLGPASVRGRFFSGSGERSGDKKSKKVVSYVEPKRPSLPVRAWKKIKEEAHHYWAGTKLLGSNMRVSTKLLLRTMRGEVLSRRERNLLEATVADTIRLVPFIVLAVIPFLEFSIPFLLRIFPNMLPSTFLSKDQEKTNKNRVLQVRLQMANFLKSATSRMLQEEVDKELTGEAAWEYLQRASEGKPISNSEIIKLGKMLKDEFALDRISHQELQAVAQFFGVNKFGPRSYLVFQLERKLKKLQADDVLIAAEGIENLTIEELVQANFLRGMKVDGRTRAEMEQQLEDWMELADSDEVPPFLLLLSRSFDTSRTDGQAAKEAIDRLVKSPRMDELLDSLPDDADLIEKKLATHILGSEGSSSDLSALFKKVDVDGDGRISLEELKELVYRLDEEVPELEEQLQRVDTDKDGRIAFDEFLAVMRGTEKSDVLEAALERELWRMRAELLKLKLQERDASDTPVKGTTSKLSAKLGSMMESIESQAKAKLEAALQDDKESKKDKD